MLHISSKIPASQGCATVIMPLVMHPTNKNAVICVDLCVDISPLMDLDQEAIKQRLYTSHKDLNEGEKRIPLKAIHLNRCPVILPLSMLEPANAERLQIDVDMAEQRWQQLLNLPEIASKALYAFDSEFDSVADVDSALYQGFLPNTDRRTADRVKGASVEVLAQQNFIFEDERMNELLQRYKARHFSESLTDIEKASWQEQVRLRLMSPQEDLNGLSLMDSYEKDLVLRMNDELSESQRNVLRNLQAWASERRELFEE